MRFPENLALPFSLSRPINKGDRTQSHLNSYEIKTYLTLIKWTSLVFTDVDEAECKLTPVNENEERPIGRIM